MMVLQSVDIFPLTRGIDGFSTVVMRIVNKPPAKVGGFRLRLKAGAISTGRCNTCGKPFCWCLIVKCLSGSFIQLAGHGAELCL